MTPLKATEGTTFIDPRFSSHYTGATSAGLIRGGYHFALPSSSSGATQANFLYVDISTSCPKYPPPSFCPPLPQFPHLPLTSCPPSSLAHGGGWSRDGITLPGMLDIEYNPYGATCYGLSASSMVGWIKAFVDTYHTKTGRWPMIYSTNDWWRTCTGNSAAFSSNCPLVLARYASRYVWFWLSVLGVWLAELHEILDFVWEGMHLLILM